MASIWACLRLVLSYFQFGRERRPGRRLKTRRGIAFIVITVSLVLSGFARPFVAPTLAAGAPTISANTPIEGTTGSTFTITGTNLKRATAPSVVLKPTGLFGTSAKLVVKTVTATQITAMLNGVAKAGDYHVMVKWGSTLKKTGPTVFSARPPMNPSMTAGYRQGRQPGVPSGCVPRDSSRARC